MTVISYTDGQHPGGFMGYRVDTTVAGERIQQYFPPGQHEQARETDCRLRREALAFNDWRRVHGERKPAQLAVGLSAYIHRETWTQEYGETLVRFTPCFRVSRGNNRCSREFRTSTLGYQGAYRSAVNEYVAHNNLQKYRQVLLDRCPDPELFTGHLYQKARQQWRTIRMDDLVQSLGV